MVGGAKEARQRQTVFLPSMYHHSFSSERPNFSQGFHLTSVHTQAKDPLVAT